MSMVTNASELTDFAPMLRDHIFVDIVDNSDGTWSADAPKVSKLLRVQVDDYRPAVDEKWDVDKWESRQGVIFAPATRNFWLLLWSIARILAAGSNASCEIDGKTLCIKLPEIVVIS